MNQLRQVPAYLELIDAAKEDGADLIATLLTHVGWNKPNGLLSIHETTSAIGREAFSEIGFPETGPTGVTIHEVLVRATHLATDQGFLRLLQELKNFLAVAWPDLPNAARGAFDPAALVAEGVQLRYRGPTPDAYKAPLAELRAWARGRPTSEALVGALTHHGWASGGKAPCRAANPQLHARLRASLAVGELPGTLYAIGETTGPQMAGALAALEAEGAPTGALKALWECYCGGGETELSPASDDVLAAASAPDEAEVGALAAQLAEGNFSVADQNVTAKTRGSAQRVFAARVKKNYGWKCALTGIATRDFLVASHIVPWSEDESIRLDPANGICLSTFVDRAFDAGFLFVHDDYTVHVDWDRVGSDDSLRDALEPFDGQSLTVPSTSPPNPQFLRRRLGDE